MFGLRLRLIQSEPNPSHHPIPTLIFHLSRATGYRNPSQRDKTLQYSKGPKLMYQAQDLKSLLSTYQIWAHRMFPRGDFMSTMGRVENVLRTRRMEVSPGSYSFSITLSIVSSVRSLLSTSFCRSVWLWGYPNSIFLLHINSELGKLGI